MHDALFADAVRPERVRILNLLMLDYSIGHELLLWQQRNALVGLDRAGFAGLAEAEQRASLMLAVLVCYRSWGQSQRPESHLKEWGRSLRKLNMKTEVERFRDYRAAGALALPAREMPRVSGVPFHYFGSPETAMLLLFVQPLFRDFGYATPFDFPLGLAKSLYLADAEAKGNVWIKNQHDLQEEARGAEFEKRNPESTLAVGEAAVQSAAEKWNREHPESPVPLMQSK